MQITLKNLFALMAASCVLLAHSMFVIREFNVERSFGRDQDQFWDGFFRDVSLMPVATISLAIFFLGMNGKQRNKLRSGTSLVVWKVLAFLAPFLAGLRVAFGFDPSAGRIVRIFDEYRLLFTGSAPGDFETIAGHLVISFGLAYGLLFFSRILTPNSPATENINGHSVAG